MRAIVLWCVLMFCAASSALAQPSLRSPELQLSSPDPELWKAQRRARFMLAFGAGLAAASAVHLAWATPNRYCGYGHVMNSSLYAAGVLGSVGVSLALGGGTWLGVSSSRHGYLRASKGQKWAVGGVAAAGFLTATALTTMFWGFDLPGCST